jgi:DNA-binding response OmpR family regulator
MSEENRSILVIDDDEDCRAMVRTILEDKGFEVTTGCDGVEAVEIMEEMDQPALIILDIMMPNMNGYQVVERMKLNPKLQNIPIMMVTAKASDEDVIEGYKTYAVDYYITKPFNTRQLLAGIKLILGYI